jgi:hypothetical protein
MSMTLNPKISATLIVLFIGVKGCDYLVDRQANQRAEQATAKVAASCAAAADEAYRKSIASGYNVAPDPRKKATDPLADRRFRRSQELLWVRDGLQLSPAADSYRRALNSTICEEAAAGSIALIAPAEGATVGGGPDTPESYEQGVARAWREAEQANREIDRAQEQMLEDYKRRAVSSDTTVLGSGSRVDTFFMPGGKVVMCRTSVRNNARATSCNGDR